ncbi:hypothetical protein U91I_02748 [alpha proteobacterium U9-1i]|nr:hypothetical protein U91I_02748 [alpha proteobacterium U9-1i]
MDLIDLGQWPGPALSDEFDQRSEVLPPKLTVTGIDQEDHITDKHLLAPLLHAAGEKKIVKAIAA